MSQYYNGVNDRNFERDCIIEPVLICCIQTPNYNGYQLIGDNHFLRFSEQILNQRRKKSNGLAYLGLCVSGQKILDLLDRVESNFHPTHDKAVLMIGTNDLLQSTPVHNMRKYLENLVCRLIEKGVSKLIVLTIPPVPRLANSYDHWNRLQEFNNHIASLHNGKDVFVVDAYPKFVIKRSPSPSSNSLHSSRSPTIFFRDNRSPIRSRYPSRSSRDSGSSYNNSIERRPERKSRDSSNESPEYSHSDFKRRSKYSNDQPKSLFASTAKTTPQIPSLPKMGEFRISVKLSHDNEGSAEKRTVYKMKEEEDCDIRKPLPVNSESRRSFPITTSNTNSSLKRKASGSSYGGDSPPCKRRSFDKPNFEDDRDGTFICDDDSFSQINNVADEVNMEYFEEWFSRSTSRKDLIHLNYNGLRIIKRLIDQEIQSIRMK